MCEWTCCAPRTPGPTARTRAPPATGRWTPDRPCTPTLCGSTARRCRRVRRSPDSPASTTKKWTSSWTASGRSGPGRTSASGAGERLGAAHHPQHVAARQPRAVVLAPAAVQQFREQGRVAGHVAEAFGQVSGAVEVAADPDVVHARDPAHVLDVVGHLGECRAGRRAGRGELLVDRLVPRVVLA